MTLSTRLHLSLASAAEPLLWCSFLAASALPVLQQQSLQERTLEFYTYLLLIALALRACFLRPSSSNGEYPSLWREPTKPASDAPGVFMSLLLVPLLCLAVARRTGEELWQWSAFGSVLFGFNSWEAWHTLLPKSFRGVFTRGEWRVVTSLACLAVVHYTFSTSSLPEPNHATIAVAGILSVLVTCPIMEIIKRISPTNIILQCTTPKGKLQEMAENHKDILTLLFQLPFWVGLPLLGVEGLEFYWLRQPATPPVLPPELQAVMESTSIPFPQSLLWLVSFLMEKETPVIATSLPVIPRYGWILYWVLVLAATIPFSPEPVIATTEEEQQQPLQPNKDDKSTSTTTSKLPSPSAQHIASVVLMRKWFHFIAVLLFGPVTLVAPQLLSLSYAIAFAILILLESARSTLPMITEFHQRYLDPSKDAANGLVISHMALIVGCALPLWISELLGGNTVSPSLLALLQLWGVLSLGIGDAMGALVGVLWGRTKWSPYNSRTLEGSAAMWISLILASWVLVEIVLGMDFEGIWRPCWTTVTLVTLLEAHTFQIDNLVLPLAGAASLLLWASPK